MTPEEVSDEQLVTALSGYFGHPVTLDEVDPDTIDGWRAGLAAVIPMIRSEGVEEGKR